MRVPVEVLSLLWIAVLSCFCCQFSYILSISAIIYIPTIIVYIITIYSIYKHIINNCNIYSLYLNIC